MNEPCNQPSIANKPQCNTSSCQSLENAFLALLRTRHTSHSDMRDWNTYTDLWEPKCLMTLSNHFCKKPHHSCRLVRGRLLSSRGVLDPAPFSPAKHHTQLKALQVEVLSTAPKSNMQSEAGVQRCCRQSPLPEDSIVNTFAHREQNYLGMHQSRCCS